MLISCTFASYPCFASDFEFYADSSYGIEQFLFLFRTLEKVFNKRIFFLLKKGICYRFNSGRNASGDSVPLKQATKAGMLNGFEMVRS